MKETKNKYTDYVSSILLWNQLKNEYTNGNILIGVDMRFAQKFLTSNSILVLLWGLANIIVIPIVVAIIASTSYGIGLGIIYSAVFVLIDFYVLGRASMDLDKTFNLLMILTGIVVFAIAILSFKNSIPLICSLIACWLCYFYYLYIGRVIIKNYLLKDYNTFLYFIENLLVHITNKNGEEINFIVNDS